MAKAIAACLTLLCVLAPAGQTPRASSFAARIAELSEPEGTFDTDNLISNERSYLHVVSALRAGGVKGGAYIGVGPDQNFSYIAQIRPSIAFIVDIRRDNLLLQLLFKALFAEAPTRVEYLAMLFGRAPPPDRESWKSAAVEKLAAFANGSRPSADFEQRRARLDARLTRFGVPLSRSDMATIHRFHDTFVSAGLSLKFESHGRGPRSYYPTYGDLMLETDREGHHRNFLAAEDDYQFVRALEQRDLVIPVVGNLSGASALVKIGELLEERGEKVSAFYTSNVEFYLFGDGTFPRYFENLKHLPHTPKSVVIRSMFDGYAFSAPPGYYSESLTQPIDDLLDRMKRGAIRGYRDLGR
jgi:hypothetical protein